MKYFRLVSVFTSYMHSYVKPTLLVDNCRIAEIIMNYVEINLKFLFLDICKALQFLPNILL